MNGYNFTEGVRKSLALAREESARLHHEYVGTEHLLLGLLRRNDGVAITVLRELAIDTDRLRTMIEETVRAGKASSVTGPDLPYTSRAKAVIELAMKEARELDHSYVGSEHLLLGFLREGKGIAAEVLGAVGLTLTAAREKTLELVGSPKSAPRGRETKTAQPASRGAPTLVVVEVRYEGGWTHRREFRTADEAMAFLADR